MEDQALADARALTLGAQAREIMSNPTFVAFVQEQKRKYYEEFLSSSEDAVADRERAYVKNLVLDELIANLDSAVQRATIIRDHHKFEMEQEQGAHKGDY